MLLISVFKNGQFLVLRTLFKTNEMVLQYFVCILCLVSSTITDMTIRCTIKIVHVIGTTISHFYVCCLPTARIPMKTHLSADLTVCYCGMPSIYPAGCVSITPVFRWTWSWHSCARRPLKTVPSRSNCIVTVSVVIRVRYLSVSCVKTYVILAFCSKKQ